MQALSAACASQFLAVACSQIDGQLWCSQEIADQLQGGDMQADYDQILAKRPSTSDSIFAWCVMQISIVIYHSHDAEIAVLVLCWISPLQMSLCCGQMGGLCHIGNLSVVPGIKIWHIGRRRHRRLPQPPAGLQCPMQPPRMDACALCLGHTWKRS